LVCCFTQVLTEGGNTLFEMSLSRVDKDCLEIVDAIVDGVQQKNYELSVKIVETLGSSILEGKMALIVEKVHSAGTLEETLLLIQFSKELPKMSNSLVLTQTLFEELVSKNLLKTKHGMHLWAHLKCIREWDEFSHVDGGVRERSTAVYEQLDEHKDVYFPDGQKMETLHNDNCHLDSIGAEFVLFYYDGVLEKARFLLSAASNVDYFGATEQILGALCRQMTQLGQLGTFEYFAIFCQVKDLMSRAEFSSLDDAEKLPFEELQAEAPLCLRLLLWPETEFRLVNKHYKAPLFATDSRVSCWLAADQKEDQLWSAQVDTATCLLTFSHQAGNLSSASGSICLEAEEATKWRVKAVDDNHIKIYSDGNYSCLL
jgi:hypothetical protein